MIVVTGMSAIKAAVMSALRHPHPTPSTSLIRTMSSLFNKPAPSTPYFTPLQQHPAGTAISPQTNGKPIPTLFTPIKIRGVEFQNRLWVRSMWRHFVSV